MRPFCTLSAGSSEDVRAEGHVKRLAWVGVVVLLVLVTRWLAYALAAPSPLSNRLQASAGGPSLVVVTLVALGLAAALSVFVVWLASVGVRERQRLQPERVRPELRLPRLALRAVLLYAASSLAFALFERAAATVIDNVDVLREASKDALALEGPSLQAPSSAAPQE